jgi:hypothetical protein
VAADPDAPNKKKGKRRRSSTLLYTPPSPSDSSHIPSPCLPRFKRFLPDDPRAAWSPKRRFSESSVESQEFLQDYSSKRRNGPAEKVLGVAHLCSRVRPTRKLKGSDEDVSPMSLYCLQRRASQMLDTPYVDSIGPIAHPRAWWKISDPTYCIKHSSSDEDERYPEHVRVKKRKRSVDAPYRYALQDGSSSMNDSKPERTIRQVKKRKVTVTLQPDVHPMAIAVTEQPIEEAFNNHPGHGESSTLSRNDFEGIVEGDDDLSLTISQYRSLPALDHYSVYDVDKFERDNLYDDSEWTQWCIVM